jgi:hypothetical protein
MRRKKQMKKLTAIIKINNATTHKIYNDYKTKKEFKSDLIGNGFIVLAVLTDKEIEVIKNLDSNDERLWFNNNYRYYDYVRQQL